MHPSSILSYYPTYALLDEILSYGQYKTLNLYFDLKNNLQTLYMEHSILNIIDSTIKSGVTDSAIFSSILSFLAFHKTYASKRNIKINFFIFFETGRSVYHTNIRKKYKISRRIDDLYGLEKEKRDLFFDVYQKNLKLAERACNKLPNVKLFRLKHLEADFIPYYLISRNKVNTNDDNAHVIYSNDHDLLQTITTGKHVYNFQKAFKTKRIVKTNEVVQYGIKGDSGIKDKYLPLLMAVVGDPGDDVDGVKGVGPKRALKMLDNLIEMTGGMKKLYQNVFEGKEIFDLSNQNNPNKHLKTVIDAELNDNLISENLKLVSFELLSRFLDDPSSMEMQKRKQYIDEIMNDSSFVLMEAIENALTNMQVIINEEDLGAIYFGS